MATVVCVPLTSNLRWAEAPGNVLLASKVTGLPKDSVANVSQLVTLDKSSLTERIGKLRYRRRSWSWCSSESMSCSCYNAAERIAAIMTFTWCTAFAYRLLGELDTVSGVAEARVHFEKSLEVWREIGAQNDLALTYAAYGRFEAQQGHPTQARDYLTRALGIFERLGTLIEPDRVRAELAELPARG